MAIQALSAYRPLLMQAEASAVKPGKYSLANLDKKQALKMAGLMAALSCLNAAVFVFAKPLFVVSVIASIALVACVYLRIVSSKEKPVEKPKAADEPKPPAELSQALKLIEPDVSGAGGLMTPISPSFLDPADLTGMTSAVAEGLSQIDSSCKLKAADLRKKAIEYLENNQEELAEDPLLPDFIRQDLGRAATLAPNKKIIQRYIQALTNRKDGCGAAFFEILARALDTQIGVLHGIAPHNLLGLHPIRSSNPSTPERIVFVCLDEATKSMKSVDHSKKQMLQERLAAVAFKEQMQELLKEVQESPKKTMQAFKKSSPHPYHALLLLLYIQKHQTLPNAKEIQKWEHMCSKKNYAYIVENFKEEDIPSLEALIKRTIYDSKTGSLHVNTSFISS